jgi:hypothetical protein
MHSVSEYLAGESSKEQMPSPGYGLEEKKGQSRAQQAAIAISLQKAGKKPK